MYQEQFMKRAIALSAQALQTPGTEPFAALVVKDGAVVGEGFNHSVAHFDPTSHGEIEAIRDACRKLQTVDLGGCDLYTSCEPCALCVAAMRIAGIGQLYYAASSLICCAHAISEGGRLVLGAQAGPRRLAEVFRKAGFTHFRRAAETPFNLVFEVRR